MPPVASGLRLDKFDLRLDWPDRDRWRERAVRLAWLRDAELVKIEQAVVAAGERTLELPQLRLSSPPPAWR